MRSSESNPGSLVMRPDMHEVIIERPRRGHHTERYPRTRMVNRGLPRNREDDPPVRESMGRYYRGKSLNENLAPLVRFLRSNTGRPWSKVRSEMMRYLSVTSAVQKHVMDHVRQYVTETAWQDELGGWVGPDAYGRLLRPHFFVHPKTGHLLEVPPDCRKRSARMRRLRNNPHVRVLSPTCELRRIHGIWYEVTIAPIPEGHGPLSRTTIRDAVAKVNPSGWYHHDTGLAESMRDHWRERRYAQAIRQLSKREIRHHLG
jgi:hypothetical protein